jgi:hypothetical protein
VQEDDRFIALSREDRAMLRTLLENRAAQLLMLFGVMCVTGCATTERQLLLSQIDLTDKGIVQSRQMMAQLQAQSGGPGPYDAKIYISTPVLNDALNALSGLTFAIPGIEATANVNQVRLTRYGAMPAVFLDAQAKKSHLTVKIVATAVLIPVDTPGDLKLSILSFVPDVQWYWIDITKWIFVRELLAVQVNKITDQMPIIHLPAQGSVTLGGPAMDQDVTFQVSPTPSYLTMRIHIPATQWSPTYNSIRYYFLGDGIYAFGDLQ